ncbi:MAG: thioredoxin [bacterium]|nr:thioredoxin [bacterium]
MSDTHLELTDANFAAKVETSHGIMVIDFWAPWCGPCLMLEPILDEVAASFKDDANVFFAKLMVDDNPQMTEKYEVSSLPTIGFFVDGKLIDQTLGVQTKENIIARIKAVQAKATAGN